MMKPANKASAILGAIALISICVGLTGLAVRDGIASEWHVLLPIALVSCALAVRWRYVSGDEEPSATALATDECIMRNYAGWAEQGWPEPTLRIYTHRDYSVLVGRYQNVDAEADQEECKALGIDINRRMTGGGTVLVGSRQLTVTLSCSIEDPVIPAHPGRVLQKLAKGITEGLSGIGISAEFRSKNDIVVGGRKIGGSALCIEEDGSFQYGATVLVDFDIPLMLRALKTPAAKLADKGVTSYEQRLTTVTQELGRSPSMDTVREAIRGGFERAFKTTMAPTPLDEQELARIQELAQSKYSSRDWIYRREPASDMLGEYTTKLPGGLLRVYVSLAGDTIKGLMITGDFVTGGGVINDIESALKWSRFDRESIRRTVRTLMSGREQAIQGIAAPMLADAICTAVENARSADQTGIIRKPAGS